MVTGSHIPANRNGLKFYTVTGEITKDDEIRITAALGHRSDVVKPAPMSAAAASKHFADRYRKAFGPAALRGRRVGVFTHSAAGRDLLLALLGDLGAETVELGRSDHFIPVDTEAIDPDTRQTLTAWARAHTLDAIASTDGDSDRPMLADENGVVIPGDIMGQITATALGAEVVVTPISSNGGVTLLPEIREVILTRIGSPFVIAGMGGAKGRVVGYEPNGGFLLGFEASGPAGPIPPLPTRDSFLPIIATLAQPGPLSAIVAAQPARFTRAGRLQDVPVDMSAELVSRLTENSEDRAAFLHGLGAEASLDTTDGLRISLEDGGIVHLRPSGNAPELRLYTEAQSPEAAQRLLDQGVLRLQALVGQ
jgi:phosphomannomutase